jgi:hypothetical protein
MYAGGECTVPTDTTTGWRPVGALDGIVKLICNTPTDQLGMAS